MTDRAHVKAVNDLLIFWQTGQRIKVCLPNNLKSCLRVFVCFPNLIIRRSETSRFARGNRMFLRVNAQGKELSLMIAPPHNCSRCTCVYRTRNRNDVAENKTRDPPWLREVTYEIADDRFTMSFRPVLLVYQKSELWFLPPKRRMECRGQKGLATFGFNCSKKSCTTRRR